MSENIEWGPAIAVDGKRPGWLGDNDLMQWSWDEKKWYGKGVPARKYFLADDEPFDFIRLPADHPHYRQPAPIDWSGELEAVHEDGRVKPAFAVDKRRVSDYRGVRIEGEIYQGIQQEYWFHEDGLRVHDRDWRIRNVPQPTPAMDECEPGVELVDQLRGRAAFLRNKGEQKSPGLMEQAADKTDWLRNIPDAPDAPTPQADTKPDVTAELEDIGQQLAALMEKHEALTERVARMPLPSAIRKMDLKLDPDLIEARKLVAERTGRLQIECGYSRSVLNGEQDDHPAVINTLAAIKRGRELALAGETLQEAKTTLDVFLAAYDACADHALVNRAHDDDLLTYGHLRTILRALTGETGK